MERFTRQEAERMGAFEETGIDAKDALAAAVTLPLQPVTDEEAGASRSEPDPL